MMKLPGWPDSRSSLVELRKVRTPESAKPGKPRDGATCRLGQQKYTACEGKGEIVV
jgi:hypothetical protein